MRILRCNEGATTPWKNGRGVASRLAIWPHGATRDECTWEVSRHRIEADGPFPEYPGFDRHLVLISGGAFELDVDGPADRVRFTHAVTTPLVAFAFRGDWAVECRLRGGPADVLDVFTRRGVAGARIDTLVPAHAMPLSKPGGEALIAFVTAGTVAAWGRWGETRLAPGDAAIVDESGPEEIAVAAAGPDARMLAVRIRTLA